MKAIWINWTTGRIYYQPQVTFLDKGDFFMMIAAGYEPYFPS